MVALKLQGPIVEPDSYAGYWVYLSGSSKESKPTNVLEGSRFIESDTGHRFIFNAESSSWTDMDEEDT